MSGTLYLVATPIGNLEDITLRALRVLQEVDIIAAEDTRVSGRLLQLLEIKKPLISYYEHNKKLRSRELLDRLAAGEHIALVSDAGLPAISDPGADLLREAVTAGFAVEVIPGANAALTALVLSGLPTERFAFEGFLPRDAGKRRRFLQELSQEPRTMIFYEAPHRLLAVLTDMAELFGDERPAAASRELTKLYEETLRSTLGKLLHHFTERAPRGEFTLVVAGCPAAVPVIPDDQELLHELEMLLNEGCGRKEAARQVAQRYHLPVKRVYAIGLEQE